MIQTRTEKKTLTPDDALDVEDIDPSRDEALERGLLEHDTMTFQGHALRPMSLGTFTLMQRAKLRILAGDTTNVLADTMTFLLLHAEDNQEIRRAIYAGGSVLDDYIYQKLDDWLGSIEELTAFAPTIQQMTEDFFKTRTRSISPAGPAKKKRGRRTG